MIGVVAIGCAPDPSRGERFQAAAKPASEMWCYGKSIRVTRPSPNGPGAFFIVHLWEIDERTKINFEPMTREEVLRLVERTDNLEIIDSDVVEAPPQAEAEETPRATVYVRGPVSLKQQIEVAASEEKLSVNA
jgi:hypothetical protein